MKLLLDTHVFIWWVDHPEKLSPAALSALEDEANGYLGEQRQETNEKIVMTFRLSFQS